MRRRLAVALALAALAALLALASPRLGGIEGRGAPGAEPRGCAPADVRDATAGPDRPSAAVLGAVYERERR